MLTDLLQNLFPSVVSGFVGAFVTVRLAMHRFYEEKHWERRADAYSSILDALHNIRKCAKIFSDVNLEGTKLSEENDKRISEQYFQAHREFDRRVDVSSHLLHRQAEKILMKAKEEFDNIDPSEGPLFDIYDQFVNIAEQAISDFKEISLLDLRYARHRRLWVSNWKIFWGRPPKKE